MTYSYSEEEIRRRYREEGWGQLAEEDGLDPLRVESQARRAYQFAWEKLQQVQAVAPTVGSETQQYILNRAINKQHLSTSQALVLMELIGPLAFHEKEQKALILEPMQWANLRHVMRQALAHALPYAVTIQRRRQHAGKANEQHN